MLEKLKSMGSFHLNSTFPTTDIPRQRASAHPPATPELPSSLAIPTESPFQFLKLWDRWNAARSASEGVLPNLSRKVCSLYNYGLYGFYTRPSPRAPNQSQQKLPCPSQQVSRLDYMIAHSSREFHDALIQVESAPMDLIKNPPQNLNSNERLYLAARCIQTIPRFAQYSLNQWGFSGSLATEILNQLIDEPGALVESDLTRSYPRPIDQASLAVYLFTRYRGAPALPPYPHQPFPSVGIRTKKIPDHVYAQQQACQRAISEIKTQRLPFGPGNTPSAILGGGAAAIRADLRQNGLVRDPLLDALNLSPLAWVRHQANLTDATNSGNCQEHAVATAAALNHLDPDQPSLPIGTQVTVGKLRYVDHVTTIVGDYNKPDQAWVVDSWFSDAYPVLLEDYALRFFGPLEPMASFKTTGENLFDCNNKEKVLVKPEYTGFDTNIPISQYQRHDQTNDVSYLLSLSMWPNWVRIHMGREIQYCPYVPSKPQKSQKV